MELYEDVRGSPEKVKVLYWTPVLTSPSTGCLPTLLTFAHSLAMRKPSVEAREKVRFLGTVVHPDLGTLDRQRS